MVSPFVCAASAAAQAEVLLLSVLSRFDASFLGVSSVGGGALRSEFVVPAGRIEPSGTAHFPVTSEFGYFRPIFAIVEE